MEVLPALGLEGEVDLIFADPPYFLSNGGITCRSGKQACVDKGRWDRLESIEDMHAFNRRWLAVCRQLLSKDGAIFVSGTRHVIYSVGYAMQQLGYKLLNEITWEKPNPPPNLSCRYFTHSTETVLWAARDHRSRYCFNYQLMKEENGGKQMKSVWRFQAPRKAEKEHGKHPTQKPLALLRRIIRSASEKGGLVLDPFVGSGTTGVAALELGRRFVGVDMDESYLDLATRRMEEVAPARPKLTLIALPTETPAPAEDPAPQPAASRADRSPARSPRKAADKQARPGNARPKGARSAPGADAVSAPPPSVAAAPAGP